MFEALMGRFQVSVQCGTLMALALAPARNVDGLFSAEAADLRGDLRSQSRQLSFVGALRLSQGDLGALLMFNARALGLVEGRSGFLELGLQPSDLSLSLRNEGSVFLAEPTQFIVACSGCDGLGLERT